MSVESVITCGCWPGRPTPDCRLQCRRICRLPPRPACVARRPRLAASGTHTHGLGPDGGTTHSGGATRQGEAGYLWQRYAGPLRGPAASQRRTWHASSMRQQALSQLLADRFGYTAGSAKTIDAARALLKQWAVGSGGAALTFEEFERMLPAVQRAYTELLNSTAAAAGRSSSSPHVAAEAARTGTSTRATPPLWTRVEGPTGSRGGAHNVSPPTSDRAPQSLVPEREPPEQLVGPGLPSPRMVRLMAHVEQASLPLGAEAATLLSPGSPAAALAPAAEVAPTAHHGRWARDSSPATTASPGRRPPASSSTALRSPRQRVEEAGAKRRARVRDAREALRLAHAPPRGAAAAEEAAQGEGRGGQWPSPGGGGGGGPPGAGVAASRRALERARSLQRGRVRAGAAVGRGGARAVPAAAAVTSPWACGAGQPGQQLTEHDAERLAQWMLQQDLAATLLQATWRGRWARRGTDTMDGWGRRRRTLAATQVQKVWRGRRARARWAGGAAATHTDDAAAGVTVARTPSSSPTFMRRRASSAASSQTSWASSSSLVRELLAITRSREAEEAAAGSSRSLRFGSRSAAAPGGSAPHPIHSRGGGAGAGQGTPPPAWGTSPASSPAARLRERARASAEERAPVGRGRGAAAAAAASPRPTRSSSSLSHRRPDSLAAGTITEGVLGLAAHASPAATRQLAHPEQRRTSSSSSPSPSPSSSSSSSVVVVPTDEAGELGPERSMRRQQEQPLPRRAGDALLPVHVRSAAAAARQERLFGSAQAVVLPAGRGHLWDSFVSDATAGWEGPGIGAGAGARASASAAVSARIALRAVERALAGTQPSAGRGGHGSSSSPAPAHTQAEALGLSPEARMDIGHRWEELSLMDDLPAASEPEGGRLHEHEGAPVLGAGMMVAQLDHLRHRAGSTARRLNRRRRPPHLSSAELIARLEDGSSPRRAAAAAAAATAAGATPRPKLHVAVALSGDSWCRPPLPPPPQQQPPPPPRQPSHHAVRSGVQVVHISPQPSGHSWSVASGHTEDASSGDELQEGSAAGIATVADADMAPAVGLGQLAARCRQAGVNTATIEAALDSASPRTALLALEKTRGISCGPPSPEPDNASPAREPALTPGSAVHHQPRIQVLSISIAGARQPAARQSSAATVTTSAADDGRRATG
jgi:hypothetical protein